ncbi:MAG TPA: hypothetical protein VKE96_08945 [Vicinamibacterales bacterium]|nr:hypothetical protein [Vicinamibacterales bacterium]
MAYEFSFDTGQWWATIAACILVVLLAFAAGFIAGMMWGRSSAAIGRPERAALHVKGRPVRPPGAGGTAAARRCVATIGSRSG